MPAKIQLNSKDIIIEQLTQIEVIQQLRNNLKHIMYVLRSRYKWNSSVVEGGNLDSLLNAEELKHWNNLFMWGMTVDAKTMDGIKKAGYVRFLEEALPLYSQDGESRIAPKKWLAADDEEIQAFIRTVFGSSSVQQQEKDKPRRRIRSISKHKRHRV